MKLIRDLLEAVEQKYNVHDLSKMSHGDAYDETQTNDDIKDGDALKVRDGVAVMVGAWPVMVRGRSDVFHEFNFDIQDDSKLEQYRGGKYKQVVSDILNRKIK